MKIRETRNEKSFEVYGVYWIDGRRYYQYVPYDGYAGFTSLGEDECILVDPEIKERFVLRKNDYGGDFLLHWAAHEGDLINDLMEHDANAMAEFKRRLACEQKDQG